MSLIRLGRTAVASSQLESLAGTGGTGAKKDNLDGLVKYIPVETITLFVAAMAVMDSIQSSFSIVTKWHVYGFCAILTPVILWLIAVGEHRKNAVVDPLPLPLWRMFAATLGFLVWALSVPPMLSDLQRPLAGLGALLISTLLTLGDPIFD
jgi:hypothetical protein